jgi:two-component system NarL family response regulator
MLKALIVEDHAAFRQTLNFILSSHFPTWSIGEAGTGKAALEQIDDFDPDLVFMDINLPDENGFVLTKSIKASHAGTAVIIVTAYDLPEYRQAASEAGASAFIPKNSLSEDEMLKLVESVMADTSPQNPHK